MERLLNRVTKFYDDLFTEIIYRAHHNSFKITYADIFYNDFTEYVISACGLKKRVAWKYLPEGSTLKHMHIRRKKFLNYLKKPKEQRKHHMYGDIRWSLDFWLSQLSFWYGTTKAFTNVWAAVTLNNKRIHHEVNWDEAITLYIIADFKNAAINSNYRIVRRGWREKYRYFVKLNQRGSVTTP